MVKLDNYDQLPTTETDKSIVVNDEHFDDEGCVIDIEEVSTTC